MAVEIKIRVRDSEKSLTNKILCYEPFSCVIDDPIIAQSIKQTLDIFGSEAEDVKVQIIMQG